MRPMKLVQTLQKLAESKPIYLQCYISINMNIISIAKPVTVFIIINCYGTYRILQVDGIPIKIQIWDTAGQERYNAVGAR